MKREIDVRRLKALAGGESVAERKRKEEQGGLRFSADHFDLLERCQRDWDALADVRREYERNLRYKNGDQWGDLVEDPDRPGKYIREDVLISRNGKVPLRHNYIQQFIRNIHGQLLASPTQTVVYARSRDDQSLGEMLTNTLQACHQLNRADRLDINVIEDLCLAGLSCVKVRYDYWSTKNRTDGRLDAVNLNRLFFNRDVEDPRLFDLRRIGEICDYTFDGLVLNFARTKEDERALSEIYGVCRDRKRLEGLYQHYPDRLFNLHFLYPNDSGKCRVFEVWEKSFRWVVYTHDRAAGEEEIHTDLALEDVEAVNAERLRLGTAAGIAPERIPLVYAEQRPEYYWRVRYLTPNGFLLREMECPYAHEEHPYALATMPLVSGQIRGMMSDVVDIQRYINRLLTLLDFVIGSSSKGLLMVPEECLPEGMEIEDFAREYVKVNGVVLIKRGASDKLPKQITGNAVPAGVWEMFAQEMNIMMQISGLNGAVQGQVAKPGTAASLYAQQAQNSMINFSLLFKCFNDFCEGRDEKLLKVLMQYYTTRRYVCLNGAAYSETARYYEPEMARQIEEFNLVASKSNDTPVFRQMTDEVLMRLLEAGQIPIEVFLSNTSLPFGEKLLNDLKTLKEQAAAGQVDPALLESMQAQAEAQSDPRAMAMLQRVME